MELPAAVPTACAESGSCAARVLHLAGERALGKEKGFVCPGDENNPAVSAVTHQREAEEWQERVFWLI